MILKKKKKTDCFHKNCPLETHLKSSFCTLDTLKKDYQDKWYSSNTWSLLFLKQLLKCKLLRLKGKKKKTNPSNQVTF